MDDTASLQRRLLRLRCNRNTTLRCKGACSGNFKSYTCLATIQASPMVPLCRSIYLGDHECEKSVSTFYCPSLSQTSTVGKVFSVKLFHKLSKSTASRKPTKTSSLQARNYQTTSAVSKTLPGFQTPNKTAKAQARSKVPLPSSTSG